MSSTYKGPRASSRSSTSTSRTVPKDESDNTKPNGSRQPDLTKYAKYLNDDDSTKFDETRYKPTIRAERHQVGYSTSLNQRRNRANGGDGIQTGSTGTNEDPGQRRRPANRPHIRSYSLNRTAANSDATGRFSAFQKSSNNSTSTGTQNFMSENPFTQSRVSRSDILKEETTSNQPKTERSTYAFPSKEKLGSTSGTAKQKGNADSLFTKGSIETRGHISRSGRPGRDSIVEETARQSSRSESLAGKNSVDFGTKSDSYDRTGSTSETGKKYFPTVEELSVPKSSSDSNEQISSTPKSSRKSSSVFDSKLPTENSGSKKTFLTPESCWNSRYFPPPPDGSFDDNRSCPGGGRFDSSSSCRESPIKGCQEPDSEFRYSPRHSSRNGVFEHLRSQESRRSHSLDSRNRTRSHESNGHSPSTHSNRHSPTPQTPGSSRRRSSRIDQMNSLNESNFESKSAFKEHLLNLTMYKDEYDDIMSDFKNGSFHEDLNTKGTDDEPPVIPEIVVNQVDENLGRDGLESAKEPSSGDANSSKNNTKEQDDTTNPSAKESEHGTNETESNKDDQLTGESNKHADSTSQVENEKKEKEERERQEKEKEEKEREAREKEEKEREKREKEEREAKQKYFQLIQDMIEAVREKYSSSDLQKNGESQVILEPILSEKLTHKWRFQKTEFGIPTSMGITSDGCVVVADYGNSCLEYFSSSGDFEHKIEGVKPFGIAVNKKDNIIVGDRRGRAIRIFDKFGADVSQWESKTFGWISGLAILQNGHLVICDRDRCKIGIYTEGGEHITEFGSYGANDSQLCMADFVAVDSKDRIIVADSGNHCLKLFDSNGKAIGKIASRGKDDSCLEWPKGICVDRNDNIIIADMNNNRVSMFSSSGEFLEQLLSLTPNPYNVCYGSEAGFLGILHYSLKGFSQYDVYAL